MKYVRFKSGTKISYGVLYGDYVSPVSREPWNDATELGHKISIDQVELLAPSNPSKIIGIAANFPGVSGSSGNSEEPLVFTKSLNSISAHKDPIKSTFPESSVWGEPELALIIGKTLKNASQKEARNAIFGYSIANDVTCKNIGLRDHHLARSKCADSFCPLGPFIETQFDPANKRVSGYQNGCLIREDSLSNRILDEIEMLIWLSKWLTLEPGDVILTGAPARIREKLFLNDGDSYRCEIEGLGFLENDFYQVPRRA